MDPVSLKFLRVLGLAYFSRTHSLDIKISRKGHFYILYVENINLYWAFYALNHNV